MVFVVLSGLPINTDPADLAEKINIYFGENKEIGTFRVNIDDSDIRKPKAVLKFQQGFDAMEAQRLLNNFKYIDPEDNLVYNIKALVPINDQPYRSLFSEEVTDIAHVILAEKKKRKKEKKAKKRKHSPIDKKLLSDQYGVFKKSLETADIEKLVKLGEKLRKKSEKAERRSSQSDRSASESEYKNIKRERSIYSESSGLSKRPKSPDDPVLRKKYKKELSLERKGESSMLSTSTTCIQSRSKTRKDSMSPRGSESPKAMSKHYKRPSSTDDTASSKSFDSRRVSNDMREYRRTSESRSSDERKPRYRPEHYLPERERRYHRRSPSARGRRHDDLRHDLDTRMKTKRTEHESYYDRSSVSPRPPRTGLTLLPEGAARSDRDRHASGEREESGARARGRNLLALEPSHLLTEEDAEFTQAVHHIVHTVARDAHRLQEEDKKLILDNYTSTVVSRLKQLEFTNLMSVQDIVLDYKLMYRTADDRLLLDNMIGELQAVGRGLLLPEIKKERLGEAIDEVLDTADIDELMEDVKPEIKSETTVEYKYEDGETTEVLNITVNLVPIEKRELPVETDPDKVADIKFFVAHLKKIKPNKFFRAIRSLLNEMKLFMYNKSKVVPSEVLLHRTVEVLENILVRLMRPIQTRVKSRDVCNLFRNSFPYKEDRQFIDMVVQWIVDGEFDTGAVERLIVEKIPMIEMNKTTDEAGSTTGRMLSARIKTEREDGDATPSLPVPIKMETIDDNQSEQTVTENGEQQTKHYQIESNHRTNVVCENIDEDIIIKKEPLDVISIEDDDFITERELVDDFVSVNEEVKSAGSVRQRRRRSMSESDDDGAGSDDSRSTLVIEAKPYVEGEGEVEVEGDTPSLHDTDAAVERGAMNTMDAVGVRVKCEQLSSDPSDPSDMTRPGPLGDGDMTRPGPLGDGDMTRPGPLGDGDTAVPLHDPSHYYIKSEHH